MKFFTVWSKLRFGLIYNLKDPSLMFYFFFLKTVNEQNIRANMKKRIFLENLRKPTLFNSDELCCLVSGIDADLNIAHLGLPASRAHAGTRTKGLKPVEAATMRYLQS
jgi:hypothetical protein